MSKEKENSQENSREISEKFLNSKFEASNFYVEAAKSFKLFDTKEAIATYKMALIGFMEANRFQTAAKCWRDVAMLEEERKEYVAAIAAYDKAADCYFAEDTNATGNEMLLKCANVCAEQEDYKKAIEYYERVASTAKGLGVHAVKDHYYKASLLALVIGAKEGNLGYIREKLQKYAKVNQPYNGSKEMKFIENMTNAVDKDDVKKYTKIVYDYDKLYNLNDWTTKLLLEVKRTLQSQKVNINIEPKLDNDDDDGDDDEEKKGDTKEEKKQKPSDSTSTPTTTTTTATATATAKPSATTGKTEDEPNDPVFNTNEVDVM